MKLKVNHNFATRYLQAGSIIFFLISIYWAISGNFDPFGIYKTAIENQFWSGSAMPNDAELTFTFLLAPLGATCAGFFFMQFFIATYAYANREMWSYYAVIVPFSTWFIIDTIMSFAHGAYFNIYLANLPALVIMSPIYFTYKNFTSERNE